MDEIMSSKSFHVKYIYGVVVLCFVPLNFAQAAFPLELDVAELIRVSKHKHWIVFMEKLAMICSSDMESKALTNLIDVLWCMSKRYTSKCLIKCSWGCCLTRMYPNSLRYISPDMYGTLRHSIQIVLHLQFSINITVIHANVPYRQEFTYGSAGFTIAGNRFVGRQYPVTYMHPNNTVKVTFDMLYDNHVLIEYSVAQKFNAKDLPLITPEAMSFLWSYLVVRTFHIRVDMRARLLFGVNSYVVCKLIVYDGPNEKLPIIMKINDTFVSENVMASTFQVFVVMAEDLQQEQTLDYFPTYINTAAFNLTNDEHHEISFDNRTNCFGHSMSARLCVYTFQTSTLRNIHFSLMALQFTGSYQGKHFTAGIVLFNQGHGTTTELFELSHEFIDLDITSTGKTLHVAVFVYSVFASLSLQFAVSATNCNVLLATNDNISYSGHITPVDNTLRAFKINFMDSDDCSQVQFISTSYKIDIILPHYTPTLLNIYKTTLLPFYTVGCHIDYHQDGYRPYIFDRKFYRYTNIEMIMHIIKSFAVYPCEPARYLKIRIKQVSCKLPCNHLSTGQSCPLSMSRDISVKNTCDVCANRYILCTSRLLTDNISFVIGIKFNMCSVRLHLMTRKSYPYGIPFITLAIKRDNALVTIPDFTGETIITIMSEGCLTEIPINALHSNAYHNSPKKEITTHFMKDVIWNGAVYRPYFSQLFPIDWETAAQFCLKANMALLTIHSLTEYHFLKKTFFVSHDMLILYVGLHRQVIYSRNCHRIAPIKWLNS